MRKLVREAAVLFPSVILEKCEDSLKWYHVLPTLMANCIGITAKQKKKLPSLHQETGFRRRPNFTAWFILKFTRNTD
jgi:hypothetical protein